MWREGLGGGVVVVGGGMLQDQEITQGIVLRMTTQSAVWGTNVCGAHPPHVPLPG